MGMFAFRLTLLLCSLTIYESLDAASVLENSSDLWRNWLLNENEEIPSQQSPPLSRRITPKSVFIAPIFDKCPPGTRLDAMGKCVKIVRIDEEANAAAKWEALVNKLNAAFSQTSFKAVAPQAPNQTSSTTTEAEPASSTQSEHTNTTDLSSEDMSGPLQLSIPFNSKNSSENTEEDGSGSPLGNLTALFNESAPLETTTETETASEFTTEGYEPDATTVLSQFEVTFSTAYPETDSVGNQSGTEFASETLESTTLLPTAGTEPTVMPTLPKRYYVHSIQQQQQQLQPHWVYPSSGSGSTSEVKLDRAPSPVASVIYSYTSDDILKVPVRFPESAQRNKSGVADAPSNRLHVYHRHNSSDSPGRGGAFSTNNDSDISDSTISDSSSSSSSISSGNNLILSSSNSGRKELYQKLPSSGRMPSKFGTLTGSDKTSYLMNVNRGGGAPPPPPPQLPSPPLTTVIRFPGVYPKGTSMVRFPAGGIVDQLSQQQQTDQTVAFPEVDVGAAASRYWESNRYPTSYWNPWDASKAHFVRIWPSNMAAASTYNMGGDINYSYRSQAQDYSR